MVNVLRLDKSLEIILKDLREVVLQLRPAKITKVRFELPGKDFESSAFSYTIGPDKAKNLAWSRSGETVELEGIGGVSVCDCRF